MRFRLVTASARTRPVWIAGSTPGADCTLHRNLAADQVGKRLRRALVGDLHDIDLRRQLEQLHRELLRSAGS